MNVRLYVLIVGWALIVVGVIMLFMGISQRPEFVSGSEFISDPYISSLTRNGFIVVMVGFVLAIIGYLLHGEEEL